jgi:formyltetrahydrofolate synthetase
MKTETKTAQAAELFLIGKVAKVVGLEGDDFEVYGKCKAKPSDDGMIAELF